MLRSCGIVFAALISVSALGQEPLTRVSMSDGLLSILQKEFGFTGKPKAHKAGVSVVDVNSTTLGLLPKIVHERLQICGGYMVEGDQGTNFNAADLSPIRHTIGGVGAEYAIKHAAQVNAGMGEVSEASILKTIADLSAFRNRYYRSPHGQESQRWIQSEWSKVADKHPDWKVELVTHAAFPQPSVILTIKGSTVPDEVVVMGAHADSINSWDSDHEADAPGADDDASGVATITEVIKSIDKQDFKPQRTLKFMAYAAEEAGLRGSADIAAKFKQQAIKVVGVMQFDMTNYKGSPYEMVLMDDYTDSAQNAFVEDLIRTYLPGIHVGHDRCGYGCSDHASWTRNGFASSIPFESRMNDYNPTIHTPDDTLAQSDHHAYHAVNFAKIGVAYAIELSSKD